MDAEEHGLVRVSLAEFVETPETRDQIDPSFGNRNTLEVVRHRFRGIGESKPFHDGSIRGVNLVNDAPFVIVREEAVVPGHRQTGDLPEPRRKFPVRRRRFLQRVASEKRPVSLLLASAATPAGEGTNRPSVLSVAAIPGTAADRPVARTHRRRGDEDAETQQLPPDRAAGPRLSRVGPVTKARPVPRVLRGRCSDRGRVSPFRGVAGGSQCVSGSFPSVSRGGSSGCCRVHPDTTAGRVANRTFQTASAMMTKIVEPT